jgi:hypothetical protein
MRVDLHLDDRLEFGAPTARFELDAIRDVDHGALEKGGVGVTVCGRCRTPTPVSRERCPHVQEQWTCLFVRQFVCVCAVLIDLIVDLTDSTPTSPPLPPAITRMTVSGTVIPSR